MNGWGDVLNLVLSAAALLCGGYWAVVASRVIIATRRSPAIEDGIDGRTEASVCVVVPAHNEQETIAELVRTLRGQDHDRLTVVLALDRCTDETAQRARDAIEGDPRFEIVEIDHCPDDWAGKVHAVREGARRSRHAATADLLCFTDADVAFDPRAIRAAAVVLERNSLDLLSVLTLLTHRAWYEIAAQPAVSFELMRQYPIQRANRTDSRQRPFANGQFMMFRAEAYRAIGGHDAVRDDVLEDLALGRLCKDRGYRAGLAFAREFIRCRMYDSWAAFRSGWKRIYIEGAQRRSSRLKYSALRVFWAGVAGPAATIAAIGVGVATGDPLTWGVGAFGVMSWLIGWRTIHVASGAPWAALPCCAFASLQTSLLLLGAGRDLASGTPIRWAGRSYVLQDRSKLPRSTPITGEAASPPPTTGPNHRTA
ncbi:MAG: glycosyltransferase family 2 protein [Planctomycetota bacterium]